MRKSPPTRKVLGALIAAAWLAAAVGGPITSGQTQAPPPRPAAPARAAMAAPQPAAANASPNPAPQAPEEAAPAAAAPAVERAGRRDPFRPLVLRGAADVAPVCTAPGKGALIIGQITIQGVVRGLNGQWIAVADNNTRRAYFLYVGDTLCNGTVRRITPDSVVFEERVTDALGRTRTREVVKRLAAG